MTVVGASALRSVIEAGGCTPAAPIFDPLSARLAQLQGWTVCKLSGSVAKAAELGLPDNVSAFTPSDLVEICRRITRIVDIPLIVDADDGGGSPLNVRRTVQELEAAGVAAIELEDCPVPDSLRPGPQRQSLLVPVDTHVRLLEAAVSARKRPETMIVARTRSLTVLPLEEAALRISAYGATGADALMLPGVPQDGRESVETVHEATPLPLFVLGLSPELIADEDFLSANQVAIRFLPQLPYQESLKAMDAALRALRPGEGPESQAPVRSGPPDPTRIEMLREWEARFLPS